MSRSNEKVGGRADRPALRRRVRRKLKWEASTSLYAGWPDAAEQAPTTTPRRQRLDCGARVSAGRSRSRSRRILARLCRRYRRRDAWAATASRSKNAVPSRVGQQGKNPSAVSFDTPAAGARRMEGPLACERRRAASTSRRLNQLPKSRPTGQLYTVQLLSLIRWWTRPVPSERAANAAVWDEGVAAPEGNLANKMKPVKLKDVNLDAVLCEQTRPTTRSA